MTPDIKTLEYVRGYYYAPVEGLYFFSGIVDDHMVLEFSDKQNTANPEHLKNIIQLDQWSSPDSPYIRENQTNPVRFLSLKEGYYYFELVAINGAGPGNFEVMVQTPELFQTQPVNPTWQVDQIHIRASAYDA